MEVTTVAGIGDVIVTEGAWGAVAGQLFGCFFCERDAMASDADHRAVAIIGPDRLTAAQIAMAGRNSDRVI